ncbi:MAG: sortase [bacterium]|nr:sortase [bacterium]
MSSPYSHERYQVHQRVVSRFSETVSTFCAFLLIFSVLLALSNWPAYSRILQDIIDPTVMAQRQEAEQISAQQDEQLQKQLQAEIDKELHPEFKVADPNGASEQLFNLASLGNLVPEEMRLEVPKVFEGSIPVKDVDVDSFDFSKLYNSENAIQKALQEGVVHYPFTANPDQFGNVFITGHSSHYAWDKGKYKDIFALLHKLEVGDEYFITYKGERYHYRVTEIFEINPDVVSVLEQPVDQRISTLMTCTPVGTTLRRLIVRAELTSED